MMPMTMPNIIISKKSKVFIITFCIVLIIFLSTIIHNVEFVFGTKADQRPIVWMNLNGTIGFDFKNKLRFRLPTIPTTITVINSTNTNTTTTITTTVTTTVTTTNTNTNTNTNINTNSNTNTNTNTNTINTNTSTTIHPIQRVHRTGKEEVTVKLLYDSFFEGIGDMRLSNDYMKDVCDFPRYEDGYDNVTRITSFENSDPKRTYDLQCQRDSFSGPISFIHEESSHQYWILINIQGIRKHYANFKQTMGLQPTENITTTLTYVIAPWHNITIPDFDEKASVIEYGGYNHVEIRLPWNKYIGSGRNRLWLQLGFEVGKKIRKLYLNQHIIILPLSLEQPSYWKRQRELYHEHFGQSPHRPPNLIIIISDSTSRALFYRSGPAIVDFLADINDGKAPGQPHHMIQFLRYSSVGWGTGINMGALLTGCVFSCDQQPQNLKDYYESLGYLVMPTYLEQERGNGVPKWAFSDREISSGHMCFFGTLVYNQGLDLIHTQMQLSQRYDEEKLPWLIVLHTEINHGGGVQYFFHSQWAYVKYLHEFLNTKDSILLLAGDHGTYAVGGHQNAVLTWEARNPMSILLLPKNRDPIIEKGINILKENQQKLVSHYDMHAFFRELPMHYASHPTKSLANTQLVFEKIKHIKSLFSHIIPYDRRCLDAVVYSEQWMSFCVCYIPRQLPLTPELLAKDEKIIAETVRHINKWTGSGTLMCKAWKAEELVIKSHWISPDHKTIDLVIEEKITNNRSLIDHPAMALRVEYDTIQGQIPNVEHKGKMVPSIMRLDLFSKESCLEMRALEGHDEMPYPLVFHNQSITEMIFNQYNFRWCRCHPTS